MDVKVKSYESYMNTYTTQNSKINSQTINSDTSSSEKNTSEDKVYDKKELDDALNKLNKFLEDYDTRAEYSKHKDLGTLMIKVIDEKNDNVLLETPPEKVLDMIASLCKAIGIIDKKA